MSHVHYTLRNHVIELNLDCSKTVPSLIKVVAEWGSCLGLAPIPS